MLLKILHWNYQFFKITVFNTIITFYFNYNRFKIFFFTYLNIKIILAKKTNTFFEDKLRYYNYYLANFFMALKHTSNNNNDNNKMLIIIIFCSFCLLLKFLFI